MINHAVVHPCLLQNFITSASTPHSYSHMKHKPFAGSWMHCSSSKMIHKVNGSTEEARRASTITCLRLGLAYPVGWAIAGSDPKGISPPPWSGEQAEMQWSHVHYLDDPSVALHSVQRCVTQQSVLFLQGTVTGSIHLLKQWLPEWMVEQRLVRHSMQGTANLPLGWHGKGWIKRGFIQHRNLSAYIHAVLLLSPFRNGTFDILFASPDWHWSDPLNLHLNDQNSVKKLKNPTYHFFSQHTDDAIATFSLSFFFQETISLSLLTIRASKDFLVKSSENQMVDKEGKAQVFTGWRKRVSVKLFCMV